jgi:protein gp37
MGEITGISWCDHTFNPWIGCTKISDGCRSCYAESENKRFQWNPAGWGPGVARKRTSIENWKNPMKWAKKAHSEGITKRVFCASLADVFDPDVPAEWHRDLFYLIYKCNLYYPGALEWLLLTKRSERIEQFMEKEWLAHPPDYVRLGVTAEDQANADRHIPDLLRVWRGKNFVSYEPAIGPLHMRGSFWPIDWIICGGESGVACRPMDLEWARHIQSQCNNACIPFFFKQIGGYPDKRHDPEGWPTDLRVREFPVQP